MTKNEDELLAMCCSLVLSGAAGIATYNQEEALTYVQAAIDEMSILNPMYGNFLEYCIKKINREMAQ